RDTLVREDLQMITDDVSVLALRASDEDGAFFVAMFRDGVRGAVGARFAGEG
ncbi:MAG: hypothetical protein Q9216_002109, partial [Gyalolechia sp. 2 TL-2023]